ncbi:hypothetical protein TARUN_3365 [Trichoderma arundinaceum]|uniref:Uncharacterized protein n=1 Tax=Trichoderma arundinaceum TaxID=490622 RepID=A0A395NS18_TRIAR|nr:hypothetical protein TARUN_3365 [Trichoderma arundinaceum]
MQPGKQEFQHFIPQFLLRNFAHPYVCPKAPGPRKKCKKHRHEKNKYPGDPVLNCLDMSSQDFSMQEAPVSRICGENDMYMVADSSASNRRRLETKFSNLELKASQLYRRIIGAFESQQPRVCMTRAEKDLLRKFFFLLRFRGGQFYRVFHNSDSIDGYDDNNKELLRGYMERKGFVRPIDVWYESLEAIIDVEMDAKREWEKHLVTKIFFSHAEFFIDCFGATYMTICTPKNRNLEFILSENSYNAREGPVKRFQDVETGEYTSSFAPCHEFSVISPRLMVIIRSQHLPEPTDDSIPDEDVRMHREIMRQSYLGSGKSILEDLPVHKAACDYRRMSINERVYDKDDTFYFNIFKISDEHVRIVNGLLLDLAFPSKRIIFNRTDAFLDLLEWFLTEPCDVGKNVGGKDKYQILKYLLDLTRFMHANGRAVKLVWNLSGELETTGTNVSRVKEIAHARFFEDMKTSKRNDSPAYLYYERLGKAGPSQRCERSDEADLFVQGGAPETYMEDGKQVCSMFFFWCKVYFGSRSVPTAIRRRNTILIMDAFKRLPCRRFWVYLKYVRQYQFRFFQVKLFGHLYGLDTSHMCFQASEKTFDQTGPEDVLTYGKELNHAMYKAFEEQVTGLGGSESEFFKMFLIPQGVGDSEDEVATSTRGQRPREYDVVIDDVDEDEIVDLAGNQACKVEDGAHVKVQDSEHVRGMLSHI